ncbi:MAG: TonB-dependent receptor [Lewinellaceae bacterium]|nr:TonB-dependent receptor [Lewinellaceae bacterium]
MRKVILLLTLSMVCAWSSIAQTNQIKGKVFDATNNNPLVNASIQIVGSGGATTDKDGVFFMECKAPMEIKVSYVGYEGVSQKVRNCQEELAIALIPLATNLNTVEVRATSNPNRSVLYQPASIVKLDKLELNRGNGLYLDDAINTNIPGVTMQRRAVSSGQQFNIRGYGNGVGFRGANNNFDGQGYKVYLNNIPITDAEGITLMDDIDFSSIENVEVVKGPAGTLYGLAIAGAVNLKTVRPEIGERSIGQSVLAGDYGLLRLTTQFKMGTENTSLLLNYGRQLSDGFMDHNASHKDFVNVIADFNPNERQSVTTYFGYSNSYDERAGELTVDQYETFDYSGNPNYIKNNAHSEIISFRAGFGHTYAFSPWLSNTTAVFGSGLSNNSSSAGGWTDKNPVNYGLRSTFDFKFNLNSNWKLTGIAGLEAQEQYAQITGYRMITNPDDPDGYNIIGDTRSNQAAHSKTASAFTEWTLSLPNDLSITAGLGMSSMQIDLEDKLYVSTSTKERMVSASYDNMVSPHFALNKVFGKSTSAYISYSKGFKAPVSGNIVLSTTGELNTGLVPEVGNQFEIGAKGNLLNNKLHYQLAIFEAIFSDKMTSVAVPLDSITTGYTYIANGGKQDNKGIEVLVKYTAFESQTAFFNNISPFVNFTYSDFKYVDFKYQSLNAEKQVVDVDFSGLAVAGVAPYVANAGIDFSTNPGWYGNINWSYRDALPFTSDGLNYTKPFSLLNAKLGYHKRIGRVGVDVFAGASNITGTQYYYMVFLNQMPDAYLPAPYKINYFGGANLRYNF